MRSFLRALTVAGTPIKLPLYQCEIRRERPMNEGRAGCALCDWNQARRYRMILNEKHARWSITSCGKSAARVRVNRPWLGRYGHVQHGRLGGEPGSARGCGELPGIFAGTTPNRRRI